MSRVVLSNREIGTQALPKIAGPCVIAKPKPEPERQSDCRIDKVGPEVQPSAAAESSSNSQCLKGSALWLRSPSVHRSPLPRTTESHRRPPLTPSYTISLSLDAATQTARPS